MSRRAPLLLLTLALIAAPTSRAHAVVVLTVPSNEFTNFATPVAFSTTRGPLFLVNTDVVEHSISSYALRPDDAFRPWCVYYDDGFCPLFWSPQVVQGVTAVQGLEDTTPGQDYAFYCGVHPTMQGTLTILV